MNKRMVGIPLAWLGSAITVSLTIAFTTTIQGRLSHESEMLRIKNKHEIALKDHELKLKDFDLREKRLETEWTHKSWLSRISRWL